MDPLAQFLEALCNGHIQWQAFIGGALAVGCILRIVSLVEDVEQCLKQ